MHLAEISGIDVVPHSLIRLKSGKLSYITRRIDRIRNTKIHMEDMCQLTERLTEQKYNGSQNKSVKPLSNTQQILDWILLISLNKFFFRS